MSWQMRFKRTPPRIGWPTLIFGRIGLLEFPLMLWQWQLCLAQDLVRTSRNSTGNKFISSRTARDQHSLKAWPSKSRQFRRAQLCNALFLILMLVWWGNYGVIMAKQRIGRTNIILPLTKLRSIQWERGFRCPKLTLWM